MYTNTQTHSQTGFTIIEVLISVLVISIGLLGMAGLQTAGIQQSHKSYMKTQASMLAYDMTDRMRANLEGVNAGDYDAVNSSTSPVSTAPNCDSSATCDASEMAQFDIYHWTNKNAKGSIAELLPSGIGTISNDGNGVFTVTVMWDEEKKGVTGTGCGKGMNPDQDLKCFQIEFIP